MLTRDQFDKEFHPFFYSSLRIASPASIEREREFLEPLKESSRLFESLILSFSLLISERIRQNEGMRNPTREENFSCLWKVGDDWIEAIRTCTQLPSTRFALCGPLGMLCHRQRTKDSAWRKACGSYKKEEALPKSNISDKVEWCDRPRDKERRRRAVDATIAEP